MKILGFGSKIMKLFSNQDDLSLECMHWSEHREITVSAEVKISWKDEADVCGSTFMPVDLRIWQVHFPPLQHPPRQLLPAGR